MERTKFEYSDSPAHTRPSAQINKRLHVSLLDGHFIFHKSMQGARNGSVGRVVSHTIITGFLSGKTTGVRSKDRQQPRAHQRYYKGIQDHNTCEPTLFSLVIIKRSIRLFRKCFCNYLNRLAPPHHSCTHLRATPVAAGGYTSRLLVGLLSDKDRRDIAELCLWASSETFSSPIH